MHPVRHPSLFLRTEALYFLGLADIYRETDLPIQTHISENLSEIALVREMFPESNSYAAVYDDHGLLTPKTVLAHAVHLSEDEVKLVVERKAKVSHSGEHKLCLSLRHQMLIGF